MFYLIQQSQNIKVHFLKQKTVSHLTPSKSDSFVKKINCNCNLVKCYIYAMNIYEK